ncbi:Protein charlatan [Papilio xuthus]|uniref:Protein charlatan n=1 Tax=Papilio xuthus TaxID=66420 RepID=A0A194PCL6_PAPXU|nr:Protein charlatan [Papilio xuthus]
MEGGGGVASVASLTMDCEDMFKEITKKLYGEDAAMGVGVNVSVGPGGAGGAVAGGVEYPPAERELVDDLRPEEHITAWGLAALMQNGFPPPGILQANFTPRTDPSAEDRWTAAEEPLAWAHSRVAAYNPAQRLFKCTDCECVGFLARVAEHWLGTHSQARAFQCPLAGCGFASGWARAVRQHLARDHHSDPAAADHLLRDNPALDDLTRYLQRLKTKVETTRTERRTGAGGAGVAEGAGGPGPAADTASGEPTALGDAGKRYVCAACPYATDRRDLFTRHENIHRDEKPFHCYLCQKQFNRADHVKKHFLRMHRDQPYDLNRIRRSSGIEPEAGTSAGGAHYCSKGAGDAAPAPECRPPPVKLERAPLAKAEPAASPTATHKPTVSSPVRRKGERRYACCYCAWSGVDNWCLKRHLNTHLKPFACALCEYKAARAERLATHVHKVHNKKACAKCPYLADEPQQLALHLRDAHHIESRNLKVPTGVGRSAGAFSSSQAATTTGTAGAAGAAGVAVATGVAGGAAPAPPPPALPAAGAIRRREQRAAGAARLFGYLEASDGSGDEYEPPPLPPEYAPQPPHAAPAATPASHAHHAPHAGHAGHAAHAGHAGHAAPHYARDKENAAPLHHALHHDHCLRY